MAVLQPDYALRRLPVELLTEILTYLSPTQIARFRRVDKFCASLVDTNQDALALPHLRYHRRRLQNRLSYFLDPDPKLDVLDHLIRWVSYHGRTPKDISLLGLHPGEEVDLYNSISSYLRAHSTIDALTQQPYDELSWRQACAACFYFLAVVCDEQRIGHRPGGCQRTCIKSAALISRCCVDSRVTAERVSELIGKVELFSGPQYALEHGEPRYHLTPKWVIWSRGEASRLVFKRNNTIASGIYNDVIRALDLPHSEAIDKHYMTYCVKPGAMVAVACEANKLDADDDLSSLKKAALISEIFLW